MVVSRGLVVVTVSRGFGGGDGMSGVWWWLRYVGGLVVAFLANSVFLFVTIIVPYVAAAQSLSI